MPFGQLDRRQEKALKAIIKDRVIHDLGCGDELLAGDLLKFGAKEVIAIDSKYCTDPDYREMRPPPKGLTGIKATFEEYLATQPSIEVAFVSWPVNRNEPALLGLAERSKIVVYLGKCTDGTSCGWPGLFKHFLGRELLAYVPDEYNTLIVYGNTLPAPRAGEHEERAGLDWDKVQPYYQDRRRHAGA